MIQSYFQVDNNNFLYYEFIPNDSKPLVVNIHGGPGGRIDSDFFKYNNEFNYALLAYEQRGCNRSFPHLITENNTVNSNLDDLYKIIMHFKKPNQKVILAGFSYGTQLSVLFAKKYPNLVYKIILVGLWLGDTSAVKHLYEDTLLMYPDVANKLFNSTKISIPEQHLSISTLIGWKEWLTWEIFCGEFNKNSLKKDIIEDKFALEFRPDLYSISFFESFFFSQPDYTSFAISFEDLNSLKNKIIIYQGIEDDVCPKLNESFLIETKLPYQIMKTMGHMPYDDNNITVYTTLGMDKFSYKKLKLKRSLKKLWQFFALKK